MNKDLPLSITVRVDCTNFSTMRMGLEAIAKLVGHDRSLVKGAVYMDREFDIPYWQATVLDIVRSLEEADNPPPSPDAMSNDLKALAAAWRDSAADRRAIAEGLPVSNACESETKYWCKQTAAIFEDCARRLEEICEKNFKS